MSCEDTPGLCLELIGLCSCAEQNGNISEVLIHDFLDCEDASELGLELSWLACGAQYSNISELVLQEGFCKDTPRLRL